MLEKRHCKKLACTIRDMMDASDIIYIKTQHTHR